MTSDLPGNLTGNNPLVNWLNRIKAAVHARTLQEGLGYKIRRSPSGVTLQILPGGGRAAQPASPIQRYLITLRRGDYYHARTWDGDTAGSETIYIAKPAKLRQSINAELIGGNLITYTYNSDTSRTATFSTFFENQIVIPWYLTGDQIFAIKPIGGTGVVTAAPDTVGQTIEWLDLNIDARAWALAFG